MFTKAIRQNLGLNSHQIQQLELYLKELTYFNQKFCLISRAQPWFKPLIVDCLVGGRIALQELNEHDPIADIGSGAGFPGLILAILSPQQLVYLYEISQKKAEFLKHIAWKLSLKNIQVKNIPIQDEKPDTLTQAVSKAFFPLEKRLILTQKVFKKGAFYCHFQSLSWPKPWAELSPPTKKAWALVKTRSYSHPWLASKKNLLITRRKPF